MPAAGEAGLLFGRAMRKLTAVIPARLNRLCCLGMLAVLGCGEISTVTVPPSPKPAPELEGGLTWINSSPLRLADLRGKVVLLNFFEYSCVNCLRTFPYLKEWQKRYADAGLVMIGVHTPQYGFSMDPQNVYAAVARLGLSYPVVVDSDFHIAEAYQNKFWPRTFLIDKEGLIRFDHTGEGAYPETELKIQQLLREIDPARAFPAVMQPVHDFDRPGANCYPITPELYLGQLRGELHSPSTTLTNDLAFYQLPDTIEPNKVYAHGEWSNQSEYLRHTRDTDELEDFILVPYHAVEVNVVMKAEDVYWKQVFIQRDGEWLPKSIAGHDVQYDEDGRSFAKVNQARMYNLIKDQPYGSHELRLYVTGKGLSVYSFSFGTCVVPEEVDQLKAGKESR